MEPVTIVLAFMGVLYIVNGGGLVLAPEETLAFNRRMISTRLRVRILGGLLALIGAALIVAARGVRADHGDASVWIEGFGWFFALSAVWFLAAPGNLQSFTHTIWDAFSDPDLLRFVGALDVGLGVYLFWVAIFLQT